MNQQLHIIGVILLLGWPVLLYAQNPGSIADAEMERQKILKAADQMEVLTHKVESMQLELKGLKDSLARLQNENAELKNQLSVVKSNAVKEREALLTEIGKIISEGGATDPATAQQPAEGYEHIVRKGQSLWAIANAFQKQGVKVTVDDIRQANKLKEGSFLKVGQKLFIPKK
ncbi:MAG: LysM peptidoglycan-binding domain-containing protein [Verrucomicrobiota bacterium]